MLGQRRRRWPIIEAAPGRRPVSIRVTTRLSFHQGTVWFITWLDLTDTYFPGWPAWPSGAKSYLTFQLPSLTLLWLWPGARGQPVSLRIIMLEPSRNVTCHAKRAVYSVKNCVFFSWFDSRVLPVLLTGSRWRDSQPQVGENCLNLTKWRSRIWVISD